MENFTLSRSVFLKGGYAAGIKMACLLLLLCGLGFSSFGTTRYAVTAASAPTCGTTTYCQGVSAASGTITAASTGCSGTTGGTNTVTYNFLLDGTSFSTSTFVIGATSNSKTATIPAATMAGLAVGTHTVVCTWKNGTANCGSTTLITSPVLVMTVIATPAAITGNKYLCSAGATTTLGETSTGGTWASSASSVASINTGGVVTDVANGTANITYTSASGCAATVVFTCATTPAALSGPSSFCAPVTLLSQNFNSGMTGQVGGTWTVVNSGTSSYNWSITAGPYPAETTSGFFVSSNVTGDGSPYMNADPYDAGTTLNTQLISPGFSTTGMASATLTLNGYMYVEDEANGEIDYSTDGTTWTSVYNYESNPFTTVGGSTWTASTPTQTIALPVGALGKPTVYLRWYYNSQYGAFWVVDNVVVTGAAGSTATLTDGVTGGLWTSSVPSVATVSTGGLVSGITAGTTTITYANVCGSVNQAETALGVPAAIGGTPTSIGIGGTTTYTNTTTSGTWSSGTTSVATIVPASGLITGVSVGTSIITYSTGCGTATTQTVTVNPPALAVSPGSLNLGPASPGSSAAIQSFSLSGTYLTGYPGNITVTSTNPVYQISSSSSGPWSSGYTVPYTSATLTATPVYVQFTPTVTGVAPGSITFLCPSAVSTPTETLTGAGATSCTLTPTAPTGITFSGTNPTSTSISFTPSGSPDGYLLVQGTSAFSGSPANGTVYNVGSSLGSGTVIASSYTTSPTYPVTGLTGNTTYYYTVIPFYGGSGGTCIGGPLYPSGTQLSGSVTTCPITPGSPIATVINAASEGLSWTSSAGGGGSAISYSIIVATNNGLTAQIAGSPFTVAAPALTYTVTGLSAGTTYYYNITAVGSCNSSATSTGTFTTGSTYTTLTIASGFNRDVICEGNGNPSTTTQSMGSGGFDGDGSSFVAYNYSYSGNTPSTGSFPATNIVSSAITPGLTWQIGPYAGNNMLWMPTNSVGTGTLTFTSPVYASSLYLLGTSAYGPVNVNGITLNFSDGTTQSFSTWVIPDWQQGDAAGVAGATVLGVGFINVTSGAPGGAVGSKPELFQDILANSNYTKTISNISFTTDGTSTHDVGMFAVSIQAGILNSSLTTVPSFGSVAIGCNSSTQSFSIYGTQLYPSGSTITATAPPSFQVSSDGTTWGSTATFTYSANTLGNTMVYARFTPTASGAASGNITFSGGTVNNTPAVAVSGTGAGGIVVSPATTAAFGPVTEYTSSAPITYTLTGTALTSGTVTVTSSNPDFQVSPDGSTWATSYSFVNGTSFASTLYIQYTPTVLGSETSSISITGTTIACAPPNINCTGTGSTLCSAPALPTTMTISNVTASTTSVSVTPTGSADGYLLVEGTVPFSSSPATATTYTVGASLGGGTVIVSSYTSTPTYPVTGLMGNTTYYFTSIPFNGGSGGSCSGGPVYPSGTQLTNSVTTCPAAPAISTVTATVTTITLNWASAAGGGALPVTYSVGVYTNSAYTGPVTGSPFTTSSTSLTVSGLTSGVTYYYRIQSVTSACSSGYTIGNQTVASYCTPSWSGGTGSCSGYYTSNVTYNGLSWNGTSGSCATSNYISTVYTVTAGIASAISITSQSYCGSAAWIDYNNDGTFNDAGEGLFLPSYSGAMSATYTGSVTVPTTVATGTYRMRVVTTWGTAWNGWTAGASVGPCSYYNEGTSGGYGDFQDFSIYIINPRLIATASSLGFGTIPTCSNSSVQTFSITGTGLYPATGTVTATAPTGGYQISINGSTWGTTANYAYSGSGITAQPVYVRFSPTVVGTPSGNITFSGGTVSAPPTVSVTATAAGIAISPTSAAAFGPVTVATTSAPITYTVTGSSLTPGTTTVATSNSDFIVSIDGSTYSPTSVGFANGATITGQTIYIEYSPTVVATETATITVTGPTGCVLSVIATGNGAPACSSPSGAPSSMVFSGTAATTTTVGFTTSGTSDGYLLVKSSLPLTGSPVNMVNYTVGNSLGGGTVIGVYTTAPAYTVTGLTGNTQYYFTVIPFNGGTYGTCGGGPLYGTSLGASMNTCPATPGSPTVSSLTSSGFNLSWSSSLGGAAASSLSYTIDVSTNNTFSAPITGSPFTVTDPATSITIGGLTTATTYYYRVTAVGAGTCSSPATTTASVTTTTYTYNTMAITSGLNEDIIANGSANPANGTLGVAGTSTGSYSGFDNSGYAFISSDYSYNGNSPVAGQSLPVSGALSSLVTSGLTYQLAGYSTNNALVMPATAVGTATITLTTPQYANAIYIIGCTGSGSTSGANCTFTAHYADGSNQVSGAINYPDWYGGTPIAVANTGRVQVTTGSPDGSSTTGPNFYEKNLILTNLTSKVTSIIITTASSGAGYLGITAVSARTGVLYPSLTSLTNFGSVNVCANSSSQTFTISGSSLFPATTGTVVATAPTGFQVSSNGTTWGSTVVYTVSATNKIATTTMYVRFLPVAGGATSGNITFVGAGINNAPVVAVSGTGVSGAITGTPTVCQNATTALSDIVTGGTWTSSASTIASVNTGGIVTGVNAGTATISYTYGCVSTVNTVTVTVNPSPSSTGPSYSPLCTGATLSLSANATGATGYNWSGPAALTSNTVANPTSASPADPTANGIYTVSLSNSYGCITTAMTPSVTVNAQPSATVTPSGINICTGTVETLTSAITGGAGTASYTWSGPGITSSTTTSIGTYTLTPSASSGNYSLAVTYSVSTGCLAASATTASVTISAPPVISSLTPSASALCSGTSLTLTAAETGGAGTPVYTWRGPGISTTTSSATPLTVTPTVSASTSGSYSVSVSFTGTGCGSSGVVTSSVVTVNVQPAVTLSASPLLLCVGNSLTLTTASSGGAGTPVYTWSGPGITTTTGSTSGAAVYTPATSTGMYTVSVSYSGAGCNTAAGTSSVVTVNDQPAVSVSASTTGLLCTGLPENLTATVTDGGAGTASYTWSGPGISGSAGPYTSATYTVTPASGTPAGGYTVAVSYSVSTGCTTATNTTATVTPIGQQWTGATSSNWSDATNWACGSVPTTTEDVILPGASSYTFAPTLDVAGYVHALTVNATDTFTLGSSDTLSVAGNLTNNSTIIGAGTLALNGTTAQILSGNGTVSNLTNNNSAGASINSTEDSVGITGTLLLNTGTFTTNGSLMLVSNANGNGSIGTIASGAHLSGNVVIQQYVPGGRRAFRFIGHPFSTPVPLSQIEPYIDITGSGGTTNGFTTTISNAPSAFWYNQLVGNSDSGNDPGWTAYSNISETINQYEGIRLYFRGAKGLGLTGAVYFPEAATYRTYGTVNTGALSVTLHEGTGANEDYNLIGNPYPAVTDIGTVLTNAGTLLTGGYFYVWNPYMGTTGQFEAQVIGTPYYMAANESFEVRTAADGNALSFAESNKGTSPTEILMRNASGDNLALNIYDNNNLLWDKLIIKFNEAATDNEDARYDGAKPPSPASLNFYSWSADHVKLAADIRPFASGKIIPLGITSSYAQAFIIKADNVSVPKNGQIYLHDKYQQTYTLLQQGTEYKFSITKDPASQGDQRFELRLNPADKIQANGLDVEMLPNPASSVVTVSYAAPSAEQTTIRVMNVEGVTVLTQYLGKQQSGNRQISLDKLASGVYLVEFTSGTNKVIHRLVKE